MAEPCFKLDLVSFDDPATLLQLPVSARPSSGALQQHVSDGTDAIMAQDMDLVKELDAILTTTDISYVHPIDTNMERKPEHPCRLAESLITRNPLLFQYGVADMEGVEAREATPTPPPRQASTSMAVSAHKTQLEPSLTTSARKGSADAPGAAREERGAVSAAPEGMGKKRARREARPEVYVLLNDEADAAAAKLSRFLESCIAAAPTHIPDGYEDDDEHHHQQQEEDEEEQEGSGRRRTRKPKQQQQPRRVFRLDVLRSLHERLLSAQAQGYLHLVPQPQLMALLAALHSTAETGRDQMLSEGEELKSGAVSRVLASLQAVLCELVVYSTPRLPAALYLEELLGGALEVCRYQLVVNVLALHDPRFRRMHRPATGGEEDVDEPVRPAKPPRGRSAATSTAGRHMPRWTSVLVGQLEQALRLAALVLGLVRTAAEGLIPLVRMAQQTLTVASLQTLHNRALGLVVSMFKYYPQQRSTVLDEFVQGVLPHLNPGKTLARHYPLETSEGTTNIQMATALVMQLVQVSAELPAVDATGPNVLDCAKAPLGCADNFWAEIFKKFPAARAAKADTSCDLKAWVEGFVEDLLVSLPLPEWPAAAWLLRRLVMLIKHQLHAPDAGVQLVCVELVGLMARALYALDREASGQEALRTVSVAVDAAIAAAGKEANEAAPDRREVAQELLLEHLAAEAVAEGVPGAGVAATDAGGVVGAATSIPVSARRFIACEMLLAHDKAAAAQQEQERREQRGSKAAQQQEQERRVEAAVVHYRQVYERQRSCLGTSTSGLPEVDRETAVALCRWLVAESVLGGSRKTLLKWLAEAGGSGRQEAHAANVRAKAVKLLGGAIEVDSRLTQMPLVQAGIRGALGDDCASVREAALDLMGKHMTRSADVAAQLYDLLVRSSEDAGLMVRKRAVRLLWECCVRCPDFVHRTDALLRIVSHVTDVEDTMRSMVTKICAEIWFLPNFQLESDDGLSNVSRGADQRAAQLGEVVWAEYNRPGGSAALPFHSTLPLVVTIRSIVGEEGKPEFEAVRRGAREVADVLLARVLELQGEQDAPPPQQPQPTASGQHSTGSGQTQQTMQTQALALTQQPSGGLQPSSAQSAELLRGLLALHVLVVADVRLLHRPDDPQRVIRCLAPYIKELPRKLTDAAGRRKAEQLLVVLAVLGGCMGALRRLDDELADEIVADLKAIIARVPHVQVVTVACQCLCALAGLQPRHKDTVRAVTADYYTWLNGDVQAQATGQPERQQRYPRFLYNLGMLCRYGAAILDEPTAVEAPPHPTCASALSLVLQFYELMGDNIRVRDTALQALGSIFIAQPQLAVNVREVGPVLAGALEPSAPAALKGRCLASLRDLLVSEEEALTAAQAANKQAAAEAQQASTLPDTERRGVDRRNGEGDSTSVCSGIVELLWHQVLALATDTTPAPAPAPLGGQTPPPTPSGTAAAHGAVVRKRALEVIEVAVRGGVAVPFTAIPALCAGATDPERDNAARALRVLRDVATTNNTVFVAAQVPGGVAEAYAFHCKLAAAQAAAAAAAAEQRPGQRPVTDKWRALVEGLAAVWSSIFQPNKTLRTKFLTALLKPMDDACTLASNLAARSDPHLLSFMAYLIAELPYRKMDEMLGVLGRVNEIIKCRSAAVLARFQEMREAAREAREAGPSQEPGKANGAPPPPPPASPLPSARSTPSAAAGAASNLAGVVKASVALSLALLLKQYLKMSYDVTADRIAKFEPNGPQRKVEEKLNAVHNGKLRFNASKLQIDLAARTTLHPLNHPLNGGSGVAVGSASKAAPGLAAARAATAASLAAGMGMGSVSILDKGVEEAYQVLKNLLKQDDADQKHAASPGAAVDADADGDVAAGGSSPTAADLRGVTVNLAEMMAAPDSAAGPSKKGKPPLASRGRGRGSGRARATPSASAPSSRGRGRPPGSAGGGRDSAGAKRSRGGKRKRIGRGEDDETESESDGDDEKEGEGYKPRATRRRLDRAL